MLLPLSRLIFIILIPCFSNYSWAQNIIPRFESLGVNDGLPHSSVYSIYQDKKGFMWFGTADGLCLYDGGKPRSFKYSATKDRDVVNNFVRGKLSEDKNGNIWFTNETAIYKWDLISEKVIREKTFEEKEFGNSECKGLYMDDKDVLWMFNIFQGVIAYNSHTGEMIKYPLSLKNNFSEIIYSSIDFDENGNIWFGINTDQKNPYICFDKKTKTYSTYFTGDPPGAVFFNNNKHILAYDDRLVWLDTANRQSTVVPKIMNGKLTPFASRTGVCDKYDRLWMTVTGGGLSLYDRKLDRFFRYQHDNLKLKSLPFDLTTCLFIDRDENLWIGSDGGGVARLDLKQPLFNIFPLSVGDYPQLSDYFSKCFYEDVRNRVWFGTHNNGLNIYDPATGVLKSYLHQPNNPQSIPGNIVGSILRDKQGILWIGSNGGISVFDEEKQIFNTIPVKYLPEVRSRIVNLVFRIIQLQNGNLLIASNVGLISITRNDDGYTGRYFENSAYLTSFTTDITEMADKTVYITLPNVGLCLLKPAKEGYTFVKQFFKNIDLRSVSKDEKNMDYLWIGSGIGLIHFNTITNSYSIWNEKSGLSNSFVYGSLEDQDGNLWISTNKGLSFLNRESNTFKNYSYLDGLQSNEFNTQAFYKSATGTFYFGGINGFNWFRPGKVNTRQVKAVAAITGVEINDSSFQKTKTYLENHSITVPYYQNDFNFHFAALNYTRPEANRFRYTLEGWDNGWIISENRSARYANLPPGKYMLKVTVSNSEGIWSDEEKIALIIKAPFWQQPWFVTSSLLLLLITVIIITRRLSLLKAKRKLQLLERQVAIEAERNRISADMHDEIGSGLTHIALLSELMQTQPKGDGELKKDVEIISISARRLVQTMSEIIWALNPQNDTMENLLAYIRERSYQSFESFGMQLHIIFPDEVPFLKLTNEKRRNLYLVTKELLNNALKHSRASRVELSVWFEGQRCCFKIKDNGIGLNEKNTKPASNGIRNLKKRMHDIGGTISWQSSGEGVEVTYSLPV